MKTLLLIIILLCSVDAFAEIPGFLDVETSITQFKNPTEECQDFYTFILDIKYGAETKYIKPYIGYKFENNFQNNSLLSNYPFRDTYTVNAGLIFGDIFTIEVGHICSHYVLSPAVEQEQRELFNTFTSYTHNYIKLTMEFHIK